MAVAQRSELRPERTERHRDNVIRGPAQGLAHPRASLWCDADMGKARPDRQTHDPRGWEPILLDYLPYILGYAGEDDIRLAHDPCDRMALPRRQERALAAELLRLTVSFMGTDRHADSGQRFS